MGCNACPGLSSQTGAFIVAILVVGSYIISIWHGFFSSTGLKRELFSAYDDYSGDFKIVFNSSFALIAVLYALGFVFCITLLMGVFYGSRWMLMTWMVTDGVATIMMLFVTLTPSNRFNDPPFMKFLVRVYFIKVVYDHYDELKGQGQVPEYIPAQIELGNPESHGQVQGQGQSQGQSIMGPGRGFGFGADYDPELGSGFDLDELIFATRPLQHQPTPRSTLELPPSYESCVEKMPMPPPYESCTGEIQKPEAV